MNAGTLAGVALLGGAGAIARVLVAGAVERRTGSGFPWGTLTVNVAGSLLLGILVGAALGEGAFRFAGTALLGSFTTFSAWVLEGDRLVRRGRVDLAAASFALSLTLGVGAVWLGRELGTAL